LLIKPAHVSPNDVIVLAPVAVTVNFIFSSITPNTPSMQAAITNNLIYYFSTQTNIGQSLTSINYNCAINNTIDPTNGNMLQAFILNSPIGGISVPANGIPILGSVVFL
jgi:uncharacterized phage protein gp47/JayE